MVENPEQRDDSASDDGAITASVLLYVGGLALVVAIFTAQSVPDTLLVALFALLAGSAMGVGIGKWGTFSSVVERRMTTAGVVLLVAATACLGSAAVLTAQTSVSSVEIEKTVPADGDTVGPIRMEAEQDVYLGVHQTIPKPPDSTVFQRWSVVTVDLLDVNENHLKSFSGSLWYYAGYGEKSGDGNRTGEHWFERDQEYGVDLRMQSTGDYYLRARTDTSNVPVGKRFPVELELTWFNERPWGNPFPLQVATIVLGGVGTALIVAPMAGSDD